MLLILLLYSVLVCHNFYSKLQTGMIITNKEIFDEKE